MCTAISLNNYFGRNLDLEYSYNERVIVTPKNYNFKFTDSTFFDKHYALIGVGIIQDNYPLYYDACNEYGLAGAGLNFPYNDLYTERSSEDSYKIAPFEILTLALRSCKNIEELKELFSKSIFTNKGFNENFTATNMHYMFCDGKAAVTVESKNGKPQIYDNELNLLTNTPRFLEQLENYKKYTALTSLETNPKLNSKGSGAVGLPGDFTSSSRFVRTAFLLQHSVFENVEALSQFFHILDSAAEPKGSVNLGDNKYFFTRYSSCIDLQKNIYYYKTYNNNRVNAVRLTNTDGSELLSFELMNQQDIHFNN